MPDPRLKRKYTNPLLAVHQHLIQHECDYVQRYIAFVAGGLYELAEQHAAYLQRGFTAHGPHRDELLLAHGDQPLRQYGSQGQQRVGLLALLLAEREVLLELRGEPPLMLLDDVMSELDGERRLRLAELLRGGGQALVTATEADHVPGAGEPGVVTIEVAPGTLAVAA